MRSTGHGWAGPQKEREKKMQIVTEHSAVDTYSDSVIKSCLRRYSERHGLGPIRAITQDPRKQSNLVSGYCMCERRAGDFSTHGWTVEKLENDRIQISMYWGAYDFKTIERAYVHLGMRSLDCWGHITGDKGGI